jgi:hypothetical protein
MLPAAPNLGSPARALSEDIPTLRSTTRHLDYHSEYNYLFKIAHCSWPRKGMFQPLISLIGPIVPTYLFTADK